MSESAPDTDRAFLQMMGDLLARVQTMRMAFGIGRHFAALAVLEQIIVRLTSAATDPPK